MANMAASVTVDGQGDPVPPALAPLSNVFEVPLVRETVVRRRNKRSPTPVSPPSSPPFKSIDIPWDSEKGSRTSPSPPATPPVGPSSALIADETVAKSRMILTKSHVLYPAPSTEVPFPFCILGFRAVFHPADARTRVKFGQLSLTFRPAPGYAPELCPVVKALHPTQGVVVRSEEGNTIRYRQESSLGVSLGFDPYGKVQLGHSRSTESERLVSSFCLASGLETNRVLFTLNEDASHLGVPPGLDFAVLLYLPNGDTRAFELDNNVESTLSSRDLSNAIRRVLATPRSWRCTFDGTTELGKLDYGGVVAIERSEDLARKVALP